MNSLHLDSSSFHVDGEYRDRSAEENGTAAITITHGYSRDHRPDLKQFIVDLMYTGDGDVPLYLRVADGNESDRAIFARLIREFNQEWDIYGKIKQRWLIVESEARRSSDLKQLEKRVGKHLASAQSQLKRLSQQQFACEADALFAANRFEAQLTYHRLDGLQIFPEFSYAQAGRPSKSQSPTTTYYRIKADLILEQGAVDVEQSKAGRFILATNVLDSAVLSNSAVLQEYKAQQSTERGFRFLKDPLFFTSSVLLKSSRRVAALAMIMGLS